MPLVAVKALLIALLALIFLPVQASELPELPASLGQWYKPANKRQVWLHTMFALRREMQAVGHYAQTGDADRARAWGQRLLQHYRSIGEMVPQWQPDLDLDEAERLEQALADSRLDDAKAAASKLARSCRSCHREYRALAATRFRSPDFSALSFTAADGKQRTHAEQMELLSQTTNGLKIAVEDGFWDEASSQLGELQLGLETLARGCDQCHQDKEPKERILGALSQAHLTKLNEAIKAQDAKAAEASLGEAAVSICARCHGVHRTLFDLRGQLFP